MGEVVGDRSLARREWGGKPVKPWFSQLTNPPCGTRYENRRPKNMPVDRASYMVGRTDKRYYKKAK